MSFILACSSNSKVIDKDSINEGDTLTSTNSMNPHKDSSYSVDTTETSIKVKQSQEIVNKDTFKPSIKANRNDKTTPHVHPKDPKIEHIKDSLNKIKRRK